MLQDLEDTRASLTRWGFHGETFQEDAFIRLASILKRLGPVAIAFSGGADSAFLLRVARGVMGDRAVGVLAFSESLDRAEFEEAKRTAESMGVPIEVIETREYDNPEYRKNDGNRCYHCKRELFGAVRRYALARGIPFVLDGSNADDVGDYRPGLRARDEAEVRSPLLEAGLDKASIRRYSQALGLRTWDKPAAPCLSSRIPYGTPIDQGMLRQVEAAEQGLRSLGFRVCRVRHHGQVARVEVPQEDLERLLDPALRSAIVEVGKKAGFLFVAMDLEGFRSGSLNQALSPAEKARGAVIVPLGDVSRLG